MNDELVWSIAAAFALDLALGDPRWMPHPVRIIGRCAVTLEAMLSRLLGRSRLSGGLFAALIVGGAGLTVRELLLAAGRLDHRLATALTVYFLYTAFAARDLEVESLQVYRTLRRGSLAAARRNVSMIVGRDADHLTEGEVTRAAVETVAESTVDGIVSPLFFAVLGGAPAAIAFKAVSTLDSMVGHRTDRYGRFGWAAAQLDDALNFIPARLARLVYPLGALLCGLDAVGCWRISWRDGWKSPSPNAGIGEAAVAGALGVRLGGANVYGGVKEVRPLLGDSTRPLEPEDIRRTVRLMYATSMLVLVLLLGARALVVLTEPWKHFS